MVSTRPLLGIAVVISIKQRPRLAFGPAERGNA